MHSKKMWLQMLDGISDKLKLVYGRIGTWGVIEALLHPVLVPVFAISAWIRTLWASRALLYGQWGRYQGFHPQNSLNSFFYKTQWLNFERYGRHGVSPVVGLGEYPLSRWFHISQLSSYLYANAGAVTTLLGTLVWVLTHLIWTDTVGWKWSVVITVILLFSSTSFAMAFARQNYNILGWMCLPMALFAVLTDQWSLAALVWLAASMASITVIFSALPLMLMYAISTGHWEALFSLLPAKLKLGLHLLPMLSSGGLKSSLFNVAKIIGLTSVGVRYRRKSMRLGIGNLYLISIYSLSCGMLWWRQDTIPVLPLTALGLFILNQRFIRFADDQSLILLFTTALCVNFLTMTPDVIGLLGFILAVNPLPPVLHICSSSKHRSVVRTQPLAPYDCTRIRDGIENLLESVPTDSRIVFAFEDPRGVYEHVFDGHRVLLELPFHIAAGRSIHLFPDWYAVAETNYQGGPSCWGRSPLEVLDNARRWDANFTIVYQESGTDLAIDWKCSGFVEKASFDWGQWSSELHGYKLWGSEHPPKWWLLEVPTRLSST